MFFFFPLFEWRLPVCGLLKERRPYRIGRQGVIRTASKTATDMEGLFQAENNRYLSTIAYLLGTRRTLPRHGMMGLWQVFLPCDCWPFPGIGL